MTLQQFFNERVADGHRWPLCVTVHCAMKCGRTDAWLQDHERFPSQLNHTKTFR